MKGGGDGWYPERNGCHEETCDEERSHFEEWMERGFSRSKVFVIVHSLELIFLPPLAEGSGCAWSERGDVRTFIRRHEVTRCV